jgi:hypothetical protein
MLNDVFPYRYRSIEILNFIYFICERYLLKIYKNGLRLPIANENKVKNKKLQKYLLNG